MTGDTEETATPPRLCARRRGFGLRRFLSRAGRNADGSVAVEFGLIAIPLFVMIFGIVEVGMYFAAGLVLEGASASAGRTVRTGAAQLSADPDETFRTALCDHAEVMLDCSKIQYEVIHIGSDSFAGAENMSPEFDEDGNLVPRGFDVGNSNDIIMIRTVYRYEFITPFIGALMTGDAGRNWMNHISTSVIKAEPYVFGED